MRGGASRGPDFNAADLPSDRDTIAKILLQAVGTGHPLNIDGIGGGNAVAHGPAGAAPSGVGASHVLPGPPLGVLTCTRVLRIISRLREIVWPVCVSTIVPKRSYVPFMMSADGSEHKTACGELFLPPIKPSKNLWLERSFGRASISGRVR